MSLGPDGAMYVLDYGSNWYAHNPDSRLTRITYQYGNRPPIAKVNADKLEGAAPMKASFSASDSYDPDQNDKLNFNWIIGGKESFSGEMLEYTFENEGEYEITLQVTDQKGLTNEITETVFVGNEPPNIDLLIEGNESFFQKGNPVSYKVKVIDAEDGSTEDYSINEENIATNSFVLKNVTNVRDVRCAGIS